MPRPTYAARAAVPTRGVREGEGGAAVSPFPSGLGRGCCGCGFGDFDGVAFCTRVDVGQVDARRGDGDALAAAKLHAADFQLQGLGLYESDGSEPAGRQALCRFACGGVEASRVGMLSIIFLAFSKLETPLNKLIRSFPKRVAK